MCLHRPSVKDIGAAWFSCTMQFVSLPDTWWCRRTYRSRMVHVFNRDLLRPVRCHVQLPPRARSLRLCLDRHRLDDREHRARRVDHHTEAADGPVCPRGSLESWRQASWHARSSHLRRRRRRRGASGAPRRPAGGWSPLRGQRHPWTGCGKCRRSSCPSSDSRIRGLSRRTRPASPYRGVQFVPAEPGARSRWRIGRIVRNVLEQGQCDPCGSAIRAIRPRQEHRRGTRPPCHRSRRRTSRPHRRPQLRRTWTTRSALNERFRLR
jgi:hypothetical protein